MKKNSILHKMIDKHIKATDLTGNNMESEFYLDTSIPGSPYDYVYCMSSYNKINYPENISKSDKEKLNRMYDKLSKINFTRNIYYNIKNKVFHNNYNSSARLLGKMKDNHEHRIKMFIKKLEKKNEETL
ncbi:MAG TPA: hypothetical protein DCO89_03525 [Clostridiales bacterium]|nr:hypothetical protein [Clostridiales bacterium]